MTTQFSAQFSFPERLGRLLRGIGKIRLEPGVPGRGTERGALVVLSLPISPMIRWMAPERHLRARIVVDETPYQRELSIREVATIGLDLAKRVFRVHGVNASDAETRFSDCVLPAVEQLLELVQ